MQAPNFYAARQGHGTHGSGIKHEFPRASMPERGAATSAYLGGFGGHHQHEAQNVRGLSADGGL